MANFCESLAHALDYAPGMAAVDAGSEMTDDQAGRVWNQSAGEVKAAALRNGLSPVPSEWSGDALLVAQKGEALMTSGRVLLARSSITEEVRQAARDLLREAYSLIGCPSPPSWAGSAPISGRFGHDTEVLVYLGAGRATPAADRRIRSYQTNDRDSRIPVSPPRAPYAPETQWGPDEDL